MSGLLFLAHRRRHRRSFSASLPNSRLSPCALALLLLAHRFSVVFAVAILSGLLFTNTAQAGGFYLTERGARPMGRGFAMVAGADDPQALWLNPAGLAYSGQQFLIDGTLTLLNADFTRIDSGGNTLPTVDLDATPVPIPMIAYSHPIGDDFVIGGAVFAPNATLANWPRGLDASGGVCDDPRVDGCEAPPQRYSLLTLEGTALAHIALGLSWRPIKQLSIGLGAQLMVGRFQAETYLSSCDGLVCTQPENPAWDGLARFGMSIVEPGVMAGLIYDAGVVRIGASVLWWPTAIRGTADFEVRLPSAPLFDGARIDGDSAEVSIPFPLTARVGVEVRPTDGLRIEAALVYERWSAQKALTIEPNDIFIRDALAIGDYQVGSVSIARQLNDVFSIRLGGSYALLDGRLEIALGFNYENSAFDDATLTILTLDTTKYLATLGVSFEVTDGVWLDASYAHAFMQDRQVRDSVVTQVNPIRPPRPSDLPPSEGGAAVIGNGDYNMEANIFGLGLRWQIGRGEPNAEQDRDPSPEAEVVEPAAEPDRAPVTPASDGEASPEVEGEAGGETGERQWWERDP